MCVRTHIDIDDDVLREAQRLVGTKTKRDTVAMTWRCVNSLPGIARPGSFNCAERCIGKATWPRAVAAGRDRRRHQRLDRCPERLSDRSPLCAYRCPAVACGCRLRPPRRLHTASDLDTLRARVSLILRGPRSRQAWWPREGGIVPMVLPSRYANCSGSIRSSPSMVAASWGSPRSCTSSFGDGLPAALPGGARAA